MRGPRTRFVALGVVAILLSGCGSSDSEDTPDYQSSRLPDRYGIYAVQEGNIGRIDGDRSFQVETWDKRSGLDPQVTFIIFDPVIADRSLPLGERIRLRHVAHVRNEVTPTGAISPASKNNWVVAGLPAFDLPLDFQPVEGRPDMVRAIPTRSLSSGLYALQLTKGGAATAGRFGVKWDVADKDQYASTYCVDRYQGANVSYRTCDQAPPARMASQSLAPAIGGSQQAALPQPAPPGQGLQLRDVQAVKSTVAGVPTLTVQGTVVNTTPFAHAVPPLVATLRDPQGKELKRWTFVAETTQILPGRTTGFRTDTLFDTAAAVGDLQVTFARTSSQLGGTGL
jgi:hypothetical protein